MNSPYTTIIQIVSRIIVQSFLNVKGAFNLHGVLFCVCYNFIEPRLVIHCVLEVWGPSEKYGQY